MKRKTPLEREMPSCKVQKVENVINEYDEKDKEIRELKISLENSNNKIKEQALIIGALRKKVQSLTNHNYKLRVEKEKNKGEISIFNKDQILALKRKSMIFNK